MEFLAELIQRVSNRASSIGVSRRTFIMGFLTEPCQLGFLAKPLQEVSNRSLSIEVSCRASARFLTEPRRLGFLAEPLDGVSKEPRQLGFLAEPLLQSLLNGVSIAELSMGF